MTKCNKCFKCCKVYREIKRFIKKRELNLYRKKQSKLRSRTRRNTKIIHNGWLREEYYTRGDYEMSRMW